MGFSKRVRLQVRDRLGPSGNRWAEIARVAWSQIRTGWAVFPRECNICGYKGKFYPHGLPWGTTLQLDAGCPQCRSLERQRLVKLWFDENGELIADRSILHFAPERALQRFVRPVAREYVTADFNPDLRTDHQINIERVDFPDGRFEVVICSHVLEHVDDRKALSELYRILRPGGLLLVMSPVIAAWPGTYENPEVVSSRDRLLHFGQADHVRYYGADIQDRIAEAGFAVDTFTAREPHISRFGLRRGETLFVCRKA